VNVTLIVEQLRRAVPAGIGTYTRGLMQGLRALDDDIGVTLHASRATQRPDPLAAWGWPVVASPLPAELLTRAWDRGWLRAPAGGDVVHATSLAFPRVTSPLTVMVHDLAWRDVPDAFPPRGRAWHEAAFRRALDNAARLVVPSDRVAAQFPVGAPVVVIEEGADHLPPPDHDAARRVLEACDIRDGEPYLLTVSTLEPRKNLASLLRAYGVARDALPEPWRLVVVGAKGWGADLAPEDLPRGAVLAGEVTDGALAALYAGARCFAYIPLVEGFGLPPIEAMHHGVPVVASDVPSTGGAALEVDPLDVDGIANAIVTAAADEAARSRLIATGTKRASELRWVDVARRHVALWREVASP
jgi:glycosyltransferase involved in cell wall biosynthesis